MLYANFFATHPLSQFNPHPSPHTKTLGKEFRYSDRHNGGQCREGGMIPLKRTGAVHGYVANCAKKTNRSPEISISLAEPVRKPSQSSAASMSEKCNDNEIEN